MQAKPIRKVTGAWLNDPTRDGWFADANGAITQRPGYYCKYSGRMYSRKMMMPIGKGKK